MPIRRIFQVFYRGREWAVLRQLAIIRAAGRCQDCKSGWWLQVTHVDHNPANRSLANLRVRCASCHTRYDAAQRNLTRRRTAAQKTGQAPLFRDWWWWHLPAWVSRKYGDQKGTDGSQIDDRPADPQGTATMPGP